MINPPLDELLKNVDSRYTLATIASKRARQIIESGHQNGEEQSLKAVTVAMEEILSGKIKFHRTKTGIK